MKKVNKLLSILIVLIMIITIILPLNSLAASVTQEVKTGIEAFPESYRPALYKLKELHPNWNFVAYYTGLDWSQVESAENACLKNTIYASGVPNSLWICTCGRTGDVGYKCASKKIVNYYLDPRNFLTETTVFQFLELSYDSNITRENIEAAVKNSFLNGSVNVDGIQYSYVDLIMQAAKECSVSPMHIVVTIFQEIGRGDKQADGTYSTPAAVSGNYPGYENLYNFFNYGATDGITNGLTPTQKGLVKASTLGWTNPKDALIGGVKTVLVGNYISKGQNTKYFYKFDVVGNSILNVGQSVTLQDTSLLFNHQYMTNVQDPNSQASMLFNRYADSGLLDSSLTFRIPVYNNMPSYIKLPTNLTESNGQLYYVSSNYDSVNIRSGPGTGYSKVGSLRKDTVVIMLEQNVNNTGWYKIQLEDGTIAYIINDYLSPCNTSNSTNQTTPSENDTEVNIDTDIIMKDDIIEMIPTIKLGDIIKKYQGASVKNKNGEQITDSNSLIGTGYIVTINDKTYTAVKIGDVSGDGTVDARDSLRILKYYIGEYSIVDEFVTAADVSKDGIIDARDSLRILKYYIGEYNITL